MAYHFSQVSCSASRPGRRNTCHRLYRFRHPSHCKLSHDHSKSDRPGQISLASSRAGEIFDGDVLRFCWYWVNFMYILSQVLFHPDFGHFSTCLTMLVFFFPGKSQICLARSIIFQWWFCQRCTWSFWDLSEVPTQ